METARFVQHAVCAANQVQIPGCPLHLRSEYAQILGGDVYGIFDASQGYYGILIGDVSGHGTPAALIAMSILNSFQHFSNGNVSSMKVVQAVNELAQQAMPPDRFTTAFYGIFDTATKALVYTNAGHYPALVLREDRIIRLPMSDGIPIGIYHSDCAEYSENFFQMRRGDRLFLFTDGILDCLRGKRKMFPELEAFLKEYTDLSSGELADAVFNEFGPSSVGSCYDDVTIMIFEVE
jgi:sigma-B regulation protein RsbU (phosphoserine phosphatase)